LRTILYTFERAYRRDANARDPQGLRDTDVSRVLGRPFPATGRLPQPEGCDVEGELPVLRGPRRDDAAGGPRVPEWQEAGRTGLVDPVRFERGTGFYINPVVPEDAAAILKGEIRWSARSEASTP